MDSPAVIDRRKRRRVAEEDRKRAARACDRCKSRKSKCIETTAGACERCLQSSLPCHFKRDKSPAEDEHDIPPTQRPVVQTATVGDKTPESSFLLDSLPTESIIWPRFFARLREAFSLDSQPALEEQDMISMQAHIVRPSVLQPAEVRRLRKAIDSFPPRPVANFLLLVCIKHGTDNFFFFDQASFRSELNQFYNDSNSPLRSDPRFVCLALAVFALGSQWTTLEKPGGPDARMEILSDYGDPGRIFYNQAKALVPDIIDRPSVRSIQAIFVTGVYLMPASAIGSSYVYMGLALRIALALDLHVNNADDTTISNTEKEVRRRLWWTIYGLERTTTVKLNRPRSISADIISVPFPSPLPSLDRAQQFDNHLHQIVYAKLVMIIDQVAEPSNGQATQNMTPKPPEAAEAELKEWKRNLPSNFKLDRIDPRDSCYRAVFHLYLQYYYAWITMGKVSIVTVVRAHLRHHFGKESPPLQIDKDVDSLAAQCIKAARKMLLLFENITQTDNLTKFSFTDFQGCSIATIVILLAGIMERDSGYEARVSFGLDCLRKMAEGNMTAKMGVRFVEALQSIANEAVEKLEILKTPLRDGKQADEGNQTANYTRWAEWLVNADRVQNSRDSTPSGSMPASEMTNLSTPYAKTWQMTVPPVVNVSAWDATAAASATGQAPYPSVMDVAATAPQPINPLLYATGIESDLLGGIYSDDQTFLVGLTGFDVLDFSGFADQME